MKHLFFIILFYISTNLFSQLGGTRSYRFLDLPVTARAASLGGNNMSIWGNDINLVYSNPALLNKYMHKQVALNFCNYVSDMNYGYFAYAHNLKNERGTLAGAIQFFNYGLFKGYDEFGNKTNDVAASDYCINLNYSKPFKDTCFNIGVSLKNIISQYDIYQSYATALDFGITYHKSNFTASILAKNIGFVWKSYSGNDEVTLPRNLQFGMSYKVKKAPFKLFMVADHLNNINLKYVSPIDTADKRTSLSTDTKKVDSTGFQKFGVRFGKFGDSVMRHIIIGTEIVLTKNFNLRIAYNYRRQNEMSLPDRRGAAGLSFGFGMNFKKFGFAYGYNRMGFGGNASVFNVTLKF